MTAQVKGECAEAMLRHSLREAFVASGMLAEAVDDGERYLSVGDRPRAICELGAVDRVD
jgi:hypothetical protein